MSKNKSAEIPHYEIMYIVSNQFAEDELKPVIERAGKMIADNGGKITAFEEWGKKRLAYPIKNFRYGYYQLAEFDAPGENVKKIDNLFRMSSEILRHMITVKRVKTAEEIKRDEAISQKIASKAAVQEKIKGEEEKEKTKTKVDLKDLDEKLNKILETDDLL
jgi:small subunit ribosomal protein S6